MHEDRDRVSRMRSYLPQMYTASTLIVALIFPDSHYYNNVASSPGFPNFSMLHAEKRACNIEKWVWPGYEANNNEHQLNNLQTFLSCDLSSKRTKYNIQATFNTN